MLPALRHRVILNFEGEAERVDPDMILSAIIKDTPEKQGGAKMELKMTQREPGVSVLTWREGSLPATR